MGLLDELLKAQKPKRNLMGTQMVKGPDQPYLRQDYPGLYGALGGLLGTAPDVMEGSVLDPNTAAVRQGAEYGFPVGTSLAMLPGVGPLLRATKGLPVGMGIKDVGKKNIDVSLNEVGNFLSAKSEFGQVGGTIRLPDKFSDKPYLQINYAEVEKASRGLGKGKELYQSLIDEAQARGLRVFSDSTVEKQAVNVYKSLGKKDYELRDMTKGSLEDGSVYGAGAKNPAFEILPRQSPYPQQAALDLAQQRAALPIEQGGLGLPAGNTAEQRAAAMGFNTDAYHGTNTPDINVFDPSLVGKQSGGNLKASFFADRPSAANYYINETPENVVIKPKYAQEYNKIYNKFVGDEEKAIEKFNETYGKNIKSSISIPWDEANPEIVALQKQARQSANNYFNKYFDKDIVQRPEFFDKNPEGLIYPVKLNTEGFLDYNAGGATWTPYQDQKIKSILSQQGQTLEDVGGVNIRNSYDADVGQKIGVYGVANPDLIRSRFAAFDPFRRSAAIAATMGVAAPDLLASPIDEEELRRRQSGLLYAP